MRTTPIRETRWDLGQSFKGKMAREIRQMKMIEERKADGLRQVL